MNVYIANYIYINATNVRQHRHGLLAGRAVRGTRFLSNAIGSWSIPQGRWKNSAAGMRGTTRTAKNDTTGLGAARAPDTRRPCRVAHETAGGLEERKHYATHSSRFPR